MSEALNFLRAESDKWNPRYLAYCIAHERTPDEMKLHDSDAWPGGIMTGFILWMSAVHAEWSVACGLARTSPAFALTMEMGAEFDWWLAELVIPADVPHAEELRAMIARKSTR